MSFQYSLCRNETTRIKKTNSDFLKKKIKKRVFWDVVSDWCSSGVSNTQILSDYYRQYFELHLTWRDPSFERNVCTGNRKKSHRRLISAANLKTIENIQVDPRVRARASPRQMISRWRSWNHLQKRHRPSRVPTTRSCVYHPPSKLINELEFFVFLSRKKKSIGNPH